MALALSPPFSLRAISSLRAALSATWSVVAALTGQGGSTNAANAPIWAHTWAGFASGNAYTASLKAFSKEAATGNLTLDPITFSLVAGTLPSTVVMQSGVNWCNLVYTPSGGSDVGTTTVTIRASNSAGYTDAVVKVRIWQAQSGIRRLEAPGTVYASIQAAANAMNQGDTILVAPGTYIGPCTIEQGAGSVWINDVNVVSSIPGQKFTMDLAGGPKSSNGAILERRGGAGGQMTVVDFEMIGYQNVTAPVWINPYLDNTQTVKLTMIRGRSIDCNNGLESPNLPFYVAIDGYEVQHAGYFTGNQQHSIYLGAGKAAYCWGLWFHVMGMAGYTAPAMGHLFKSRMENTYIFGCRFTQEAQVGPGVTPSFILDFPWGGDVFIAGIIGEKIGTTDNKFTSISYGAELGSLATLHPVNRFRFYQSTIINRADVNDLQIDIADTNFTSRGAPAPTVDIRGNVYSGLGLPGDANNINVPLSSFIDQANFDFRLTAPVSGTVQFATWEYSHPASAVPSGHKQMGHSSYSTLPAWVAPLGQITAVSTNTINSLAFPAGVPVGTPGPWHREQMLDAWSGLVLATDLGTDGSLVVAGIGGHFSYDWSPEPYKFDFATGLWSMPAPPAVRADSITSPSSNTTLAAQIDFAHGEFKAAPGVPLNVHGYNYDGYIPSAGGGGPNGTYISTMRCYFGYPISTTAGAEGVSVPRANMPPADGSILAPTGYPKPAHIMPLDTYQWARAPGSPWAADEYNSSADGAACWDSVQGVYWTQMPGQAHIARYQKSPGVTTRINAIANANAEMQKIAMTHNSVRNLLVALSFDGFSNAWNLRVADASAASPLWRVVATNIPLTDMGKSGGTYITDLNDGNCLWGVGFDYHSGLDKIGVYIPLSPNKIWYLTCPSGDPFTGTWTITSETFGGTTLTPYNSSPGGAQPIRMYNKFRAHPRKKCFVWINSCGTPVWNAHPAALT